MNSNLIGNQNNIIFYTDEDGNLQIEVILQEEDVWLNVNAIAELFGVQRPAIYKHISNIFNEQELEESAVCSILEYTALDNKQYNTKYYNLDMIISIGFRVNSKKAVKFRTWANKIIKEYMIQGFNVNEKRFLEGKKSDQEYFKRLLEKIKLIRTSERMFYQKITDIFVECSLDYDKDSDMSKEFYATIQNKFHYAITKNTAAEIIFNRADSNKQNMGLTNWRESPNGKVLKSDISIAKNYLSEVELKNLNNVVNIFLDIAEDNAERNIPMYMKDWKQEVDNVLQLRHYDILKGNGKVSKKKADEKAENEYNKFKIIQDKNIISDFDKLMLKMNNINKLSK